MELDIRPEKVPFTISLKKMDNSRNMDYHSYKRKAENVICVKDCEPAAKRVQLQNNTIMKKMGEPKSISGNSRLKRRNLKKIKTKTRVREKDLITNYLNLVVDSQGS